MRIEPCEEPLTDWSTCSGVEVDPKRQSGAPVFAGTRIPVNVVGTTSTTAAPQTRLTRYWKLSRHPRAIYLVIAHLHGTFSPLTRS